MLRMKVSGMTCQHCVAAVSGAVSALPGVEQVTVDLDHGEVSVTGSPEPAQVRAAIEAEGYDVAA